MSLLSLPRAGLLFVSLLTLLAGAEPLIPTRPQDAVAEKAPKAPSEAQRSETPPLGATSEKAIDGLVEKALKEWQVPGAAVAVVWQDEVIYLKGFGERQLGSAKPVTPDTVFPLASCTKGFTSLAVAMLVDLGKLDWDDPVRKHLPAFRLYDPLANENVVLRDLLCHRTGVGGHPFLVYHAPWGVDEQIRRIGLVKPSRSFRSGYEYQGIMFAATGRAVAAASGKSWDDFVRDEIVKPLGMKNVSFTTAEALKSADHASPHRWSRAGKIKVLPAWYRITEPSAAVSMNASARDLGQWLRFQLGDGSWDNQQLVSTRSLEETRTSQVVIRLEGIARKEQPCTNVMTYGMGWVVQDYRGHKLVSHGGKVDGLRAHISLAPNDGLGVAVLSNLDNTRMNLALSNAIVDAVLGLEARDWNTHFQECVRAEYMAGEASYRKLLAKQHKGTKPSRDLEAYTGTYEEPAYGTAKVTLKDGQLTWHWSSFHAPLGHFHYDTFAVEEDVLFRPQLVFSLGGDGDVAGFRVLDVDFKKVKK